MSTATERRKARLERARARRVRMRAMGLKQVRLWVHDRNSPTFAAEARRQSALVGSSPFEADDQAFVDAVSDFSDWK